MRIAGFLRGRFLRALWPVAGLTLLAAALRAWQAADLGLWGDEAWILYLNHLGFVRLALETARDIHPPLYYELAHLWLRLVGPTEFGLRALSILSGVLSVPLLYAAGARLHGRRVGLLCAFFIAVAPFSVFYGQEARMYAAIMALGVLSTYLLLRALDRSPSAWRPWLVYSLSTAVLIYSHYVTAFFVVAHGLLIVLNPLWRRHFRPWIVSMAAIALLSIPWLLVFAGSIVRSLDVQSQFGGVLPPYQLLGETLMGQLAGVTRTDLPTALLAAALGIIALLGLFPLAPHSPHPTPPLSPSPHPPLSIPLITLSLALLPLLVFYPLHLYLPWFRPRLFAFCAPWLYLLLARGVFVAGSYRRALAAGLLLLVLGGWSWQLWDYYARFERYDPQTEDYRPLLAYLEQAARPGDVVLYNARWHVGYFVAYYRGPDLTYVPMVADPADWPGLADVERQVWVVGRDLLRQPGGERREDQVEDWVSARGFHFEEQWYGAIRLTGYRLPPPGFVPSTVPVDARFGEHIRLAGYSLVASRGQPDALTPGEALYLTLYWQVDAPVPEPYLAFAHLLGGFNPASGNPLWGQHDGVPGNTERPTSTWQPGETVRDPHLIVVDPAAPSGTYAIEIGLYSPAGVRLPVYAPDGSLLGDHAILTHVDVVGP